MTLESSLLATSDSLYFVAGSRLFKVAVAKARGRVRVPAGVARSGACAGGQVSVQLKAARKAISTRRVALTSTCAYRSRVTFRSRKRFPRGGRLTVRVRFLGNAVLGPRSAKTAVVRTR